MGVLLVLQVAALLVTLPAAILAVEHPVPLRRVQRFAVRQRISLTGDNVGAVMRYLGTTTRWRMVGALAGLFYGAAAGLHAGTSELNAADVFFGWFAGAVVAEWRVGQAAQGAARSASLQPRRLDTYLGRTSIFAPPLVVVVLCGVTVCDLTSRQTGQRRLAAALVLAVGLLVLVGISVVRRQVFTRSQPADADASVIAADDALRGQSLRVLSGSATALLCGLVAVEVELSAIAHPAVTQLAVTIIAVGVVLGCLMAAVGPRSRQGDRQLSGLVPVS